MSLGIFFFNMLGLFVGSLTLKNIIVPTSISSITALISLKAAIAMYDKYSQLTPYHNYWADLFYS